jgi:hypothetical protein
MPTFVIGAIAKPMQTATLRGTRISVGRAATSDLLLAGGTVSREHALFVQDRSGQWSVECVSTKNAIVVDGVLITTSAVVREGSEILIGGEHLIIFSETQVAARAYQGDPRFVACECPKCGWKGRLGAFRREFVCPKCGGASSPLSVYDRSREARRARDDSTAAVLGPEARERFDQLRSAKRSRLERIDGRSEGDQRRALAEDDPLLLGGKDPGALQLFGITLGDGVRIAWDGERYVAESSMLFPTMRVNGVKAQAAPLADGDVLEVGSNRFRVVTE